jgi:hypothetical protein
LYGNDTSHPRDRCEGPGRLYAAASQSPPRDRVGSCSEGEYTPGEEEAVAFGGVQLVHRKESILSVRVVVFPRMC